MGNTNYVPGPWVADGRCIRASEPWANRSKSSNGSEPTTIATVAMNTAAEREQALANAQLMAASPVMLAALKSLSWLKVGDQLGTSDIECIAAAGYTGFRSSPNGVQLVR